MSEWLNNKIRVWKAKEIERPCVKCGYCPFGQLVEEYPLHEKDSEPFSCKVFGHECPVYYLAESFAE